MKQATGEATYNPKTDGIPVKYRGMVPAHCVKFEITHYGEQSIFNLYWRINEEAVSIPLSIVEFDKTVGKVIQTEEAIPRQEVIGSEHKSSTFYHPNPDEKSRWKNRDYFDLLEALGIELPQDENGNYMLAEIEEEDVLGMPALVMLDLVPNKDKDRAYQNIVKILQWEEGVRLDPSSITPF